MFRTDKLVVDLHDSIRGQGKSHTGVGVCVSEDRGVNADHFAIHVHQRAAGISRINGSISLNK